ncbi:glutamine amidotransferase [Psychrobacter aquimaris]|uniref:glutamine amidotransferase n=1 Tax=Psychrobacter aquimaris TaxID=292733 RepID=UPI003FCF06DB
MKNVLAIRHVHFEDLAVFEEVLINSNFHIEYIDAATVDFDTIDPLSADLLVVLGAPIGAFDEDIYPFLKSELAFIDKRLKANKPLLGICLGAQLIARLLGANVASMGRKEIGFGAMQIHHSTGNPLIGLSDIPVLHWHGDQFEIPQGCRALAATDICPNQAFARGDNILALQFHIEARPDNIEQWLVGHAHELNSTNIDIKQIRYEAKKYGAAITSAAQKIFLNWLNAQYPKPVL